MLYIWILILTVIDLTCTYIGVTKGIIEEANPLISNLYSKEPLLLSLGIFVLVSILLYIVSKLKVSWVKYPLVSILGVKILIVLLHIIWIGGVV